MRLGYLLTLLNIKLGFKYRFGLDKMSWVIFLNKEITSVSHIHNGINGLGSFFK